MSKSGKGLKKDKSKKSLKKVNAVNKSVTTITNAWEEELEKAEISDQTWKCNLAIMVETKLENQKYIQLFQEHAELGKQPVVKCLDYKKDVIQELNQIKNIKSTVGSHPLSGVCKAAVQQMVGGNLSVEMLVKYLKYKIICLKEEDIKRRKKVLKIKMHKEQQEILNKDFKYKRTSLDNEAKNENRNDKKRADKETIKETKDKGKKGKKDDNVEESLKKKEDWWNDQPSEKDKIDTTLKVRGEKGCDLVTVDDSPADGAELYVVLTGFHDPQLVMELVKQKLPLNCIIKLDGNDNIRRKSIQNEQGVRIGLLNTSDIGSRTSWIENPCDNEGKKHIDHTLQDTQMDMLSEEITNFWKTYSEYISNNETNLFLRDIALFTYSPTEHIQHPTNSIQSLAALMYNDICHLLYNIDEQQREHIEYTRSMKLVSPAEEKTPTILDEMIIYNTMVQILPLECASVAFILHCMAEQVDELCRDPKAQAYTPASMGEENIIKKSDELKEKNKSIPQVSEHLDQNSAQKKSKQSLLSQDRENVEKMQTKVMCCLDELDVDYGLSQVPPSQVARKSPLVLLYQDEVLLRTHHVAIPEVDLNTITATLLAHSPPANLWRIFKRQHGFQKYKFNHHIHKLWRCMEKTNLTLAMLKNYLHLLILEKMECAAVNRDSLDANNNNAGASKTSTALRVSSNTMKNISPVAFNGVEPTPFSEPDEAINAMKNVQKPSNLERIHEMLACPELVCLTDPIQPMLTGVRNVKLRSPYLSLIKFTSIQVHSANAMLQAISDAYQTYNCFDYKYYPPTDVILMNFHNYKDKQGATEEKWNGVLITPVAFRDYQANVCEGWSYRKQNKENDTDQVTTNIPKPKERLLEENCGSIADHEYILANSIKQEEMLAKQAAELKEKEDAEPKVIAVKAKGKGDKTKSKESTDNVKKEIKKDAAKLSDKSQKPSKEKEDKSSKNKKEKGGTEQLDTVDKTDEVDIELPVVKRLSLRCAKDDEPFTLLGYDMGPLRIEAKGATRCFYSLDGTEVHVNQNRWMYGKETVSIQLIKRGHTVTFHGLMGPKQPSDVQQPLSFHVTSASGAILAFGNRIRAPKKKRVETSEKVETPLEEKVAKGKGNQSKKQPKGKKTAATKPAFLPEEKPVEEPDTAETTLPEEPEIPWEYELRASWPSGLYLETVVGTSEEDPFHIKQYYLQKGPHCNRIADEVHRLFLNTGTVLKFMSNGFVEVLNQDSTVVVCKRFSKPVVRQDSFIVPDFKFSTAAEQTTTGENSAEADGEKIPCHENPGAVPQRYPPPTPVPPLPLVQIDSYHVTLPSGKQHGVSDNIVNAAYENLMLRTATDYFLGEVFTRRGDGTNTLLKLDGSLATTFLDGTQITTWYTVDGDTVQVEWSEEEKVEITRQVAARLEAERIEEETMRRLMETPSETAARLKKGQRRFRTASMEGFSYDSSSNSSLESAVAESLGVQDSKTSAASAASNSSQPDVQQGDDHHLEMSGSGIALQKGKRKKPVKDIFALAPFVLINMNACMEHPNYATVSYNGANRSATVDMPHKMKVRITASGNYSANIDERTLLEVHQDKVEFICQVCPNCTVTSESTINLSNFQDVDPEIVFCTTRDCWDQTVTVTRSGETWVSEVPDEELSESRATCNAQCLPRVSRHKRRVFVLQRNLTGEEFVNGEEVKRHLAETRAIKGAVVVTDQMPNKSNFNYHTTLTPVRITVSEQWLMESSKCRLPTALSKKDLRSTYGDPPTWLHPFPLSVDEPRPSSANTSKASGDVSEPDLATVYVMRIIQQMEPMGESQNPIASIQEGLVRYWTAAAEKHKSYVEHPIADTRTAEVIAAEEKLRNMALGLTEVSLDEYLKRVQLEAEASQVDKPSMYQMYAEELARVPPKPLRTHSEYLEQFKKQCFGSEIEKEELKRLLRTHTVTPYFKTEAGQAFLKGLQGNACIHKDGKTSAWECLCENPYFCKAAKCEGSHKPDYYAKL